MSPWYNYGAMCVAIPGWTLGDACGAVSGNLLPAFSGERSERGDLWMFLAIIIPPAKRKPRCAGVVVGAMAVSSLFAMVRFLRTCLPDL